MRKRRKTFMVTIAVCLLAAMAIPSHSTSAKQLADKLGHASPQSVGMDKDTLNDIDQIVSDAITNRVTPGAVVLVTKDNKIVQETAYGHALKYDMGVQVNNPKPMTTTTIFDLASVTKVMGTTQGIMKLVSERQISVDDRVAEYIPAFGQNGKEHVTIADLLTHTSGLTPWQPTYLYADNSEEVLNYINEMPLEYETGTDRRYSDFSFMVLAFVIEAVTGQRLDEYLEKNIYGPLGLKDTMFNASEKTNKPIAANSWGNPYEYKMIDDDNFGYYVDADAHDFKRWRNYTLIGEVNDGNSFYANGGIAGHAGLFSTARDLAILGQTILNNGSYGKISLFDQETIQAFTSPQRFGQGYGWELNKSWYMGNLHSEKAFGHTGFTGTQIVIDPERNLQIIVLANKQNNGPLASGSYASTGELAKAISDVVYESIED